MILGIFILSFASAYYPGETIEVNHNLGSDNLTLSVLDNSTFVNLSDFVVYSNSTHSNITFPQDIIPDNFKLVLSYLEEQIVIPNVPRSSGGGGGSSRTYYKWNCTDWESCIDGVSQRVCEKVRVDSRNELGDKPDEIISCVQQHIVPVKETPKILTSSNTIVMPEISKEKDPKERKVAIFILIIVIAILVALFFTFYKSKKKKQEEKINEEALKWKFMD